MSQKIYSQWPIRQWKRIEDFHYHVGDDEDGDDVGEVEDQRVGAHLEEGVLVGRLGVGGGVGHEHPRVDQRRQ